MSRRKTAGNGTVARLLALLGLLVASAAGASPVSKAVCRAACAAPAIASCPTTPPHRARRCVRVHEKRLVRLCRRGQNACPPPTTTTVTTSTTPHTNPDECAEGCTDYYACTPTQCCIPCGNCSCTTSTTTTLPSPSGAFP
jgi:hypothetical protein